MSKQNEGALTVENVAANSLTASSAQSRSLTGGAVIVAGTAVGAGMFSLPAVSASMGLGWSSLAMLLTWFCMLQVSLFLLEINLHYPGGTSFGTFVRDILGPVWGLINSVLLSFIFYILLYAYISGGGSIVAHTVSAGVGVELPQALASILFTLVLGVIVWRSTGAVDRIVSLLLAGMTLTFLFSVGPLAVGAEPAVLVDYSQWDSLGVMFMFAALPFYLTSFGFQTTVPSLVKYYGKQPAKIYQCLLVGSLFILVIYAVWLWAVFGQVPYTALQAFANGEQSIGELVSLMALTGDSALINRLLKTFANFALITSFLGVSLGLFDFIADRLSFDDSPKGRLKTALVTFVPSLVLSLLIPNGFLYAIGYAGLALAISAVIIPALMVLKKRTGTSSSNYQAWGGRPIAYMIVLLGIVYMASDFLSLAGVIS